MTMPPIRWMQHASLPTARKPGYLRALDDQRAWLIRSMVTVIEVALASIIGR